MNLLFSTRLAAPALACAALLCSALPAQADMSFYSSQAAFNAAISAPVTDSFNDLFWAQGPNALYREPGGGYSYVVNALKFDGSDYSSFYNAGSDDDVWLSTDQATDVISFDFTGGDKVYGVGGFFFGTDMLGAFQPGQSIKLNALDADGVEQVVIIENAQPGSFYGFASTSLIRYFEISAVQPADGLTWVAANDLVLGTVAAVPEPSSSALLLGGLGLLAWGATRRSAENKDMAQPKG